MTQASPSPAPRPAWAAPLVAGLCFGLAYGVTQRLVSLNVGELIRFGQGFDVQVFPGTTLESLRLRFGAAAAELRGNLELQQLNRQDLPEPERTSEPQAETAPEPQPMADAPAAPDLPPQQLPADTPAAPELPAAPSQAPKP